MLVDLLRLGMILPALLIHEARGQETPARRSRTTDATPREFVVSLPPPAPLGDRPTAADLLRFPAVVAELGLTDVQAGKLARDERLRARRLRDLARSIRPDDLDDPDRVLERVEAIDIDALGAADRALTPAQRGRLFQIGLRRDGVLALARDDVAEALGLDDDARDDLVPILEGAHADIVDATLIRLTLRSPSSRAGDVPVLGPEDLAAFESRVALAREADLRIRQAAGREADRVLTPRQREAFARLRGPPAAPAPAAPRGARP